ncbi:MAG: hypothetical protein K8F24_06930 [Bacteroidales bacterium]|nr:hypothetical protein [Bacteroidales bacterium]
MMKKHLIPSFLMLIFLFVSIADVFTQECTNCQNSIITGVSASALGYGNQALGNSSIAIGFESVVRSQGGIAIGKHLEIPSQFPYTIAIGSGYNDINKLVNTHGPSLMIGFGSTKPTFFVGQSAGMNNTGKIGIGNVTSPQAKLHILADADEDASLLLEPSNPKEFMAKLNLMDTYSGLSVDARSGLELFTNLGSMQFEADEFNFAGNQVNMPALRINNAYSLPTTVGKPGEFLNSNGLWETPEGGGETYWLPSGTDIYFSNNVGIGTSDLHGYQLAVKGKIISEEVVIQFYNAWQWPDFVFDETYALMPLAELEQFIHSNKHLPGPRWRQSAIGVLHIS